MSLPLPAGPDYPLRMPPDGIFDRTRGAITDQPQPAKEGRLTGAGEPSRRRSADLLAGYRSALSR